MCSRHLIRAQQPSPCACVQTVPSALWLSSSKGISFPLPFFLFLTSLFHSFHLHCEILQTVWVLWGLILWISCAIGSAPLGLVFCVKTHLCTHLWSRLQWWWSWSLPSSLLSSRNGKKNEKLIIALYNFFFNLLFILYWSTVSVLVSGVQQIDSVIHIHLPFFVRFCSLYRLLQNIEQSSLCYTGGPCSVSILYIVACIC